MNGNTSSVSLPAFIQLSRMVCTIESRMSTAANLMALLNLFSSIKSDGAFAIALIAKVCRVGRTRIDEGTLEEFAVGPEDRRFEREPFEDPVESMMKD